VCRNLCEPQIVHRDLGKTANREVIPGLLLGAHGDRGRDSLEDRRERSRSAPAIGWLAPCIGAPEPNTLRTFGDAARTFSIIFAADAPPTISIFSIRYSTSLFSISLLIRRRSRFETREDEL
jgi:hypothetical protein